MKRLLRTLPILLLFLVLEALCALMWISGTVGMAAATLLLLGYDASSGLGLFGILCAVWGLLFAIPEVLLMLQSAIWTRGLNATTGDIKRWELKSSSTGPSAQETVDTE